MSAEHGSDAAGAQRAAEQIVAAFGAHDVEAYFAGFDEAATFVFHNHPEVLTSRQAYADLWRQWEEEGFHVEGCTSSDRQCDLVGDGVAVFTHRVRTRLTGEDEQRERETIVLAIRDGRWLGVHEHLSLDPADT